MDPVGSETFVSSDPDTDPDTDPEKIIPVPDPDSSGSEMNLN